MTSIPKKRYLALILSTLIAAPLAATAEANGGLRLIDTTPLDEQISLQLEKSALADMMKYDQATADSYSTSDQTG